MKSTISHISLLAAVFIVLTMIRTSPALAQGCQLGLNVTYTPVQQLSIADIDFEHFQSRSLLFTVSITNNGLIPATARLRGTMRVRLSNGQYNGTALTFLSESFSVPLEGRVVTNLQLGNNSDIKMDEFDFDDAAKTNVQDVALSTGKFPAGLYTLKILLEEVACPVVEDKDIELDLRNPSRIELRSPRDGETTSEFPLFEFFSDEYPVVLTVAEFESGQSRSDALSRKPAMLEVELTGQSSFLYSGGRPLEQEKQYVWNVKHSTFGTGGSQNVVMSPIGLFTVSNLPPDPEAGSAVTGAIISRLKEIFGERYPGIFEQIENGNFKISGSFSLNQTPQTEAQLLQLLNDLQEISDSVDLTFE